MKHQIKLQRAIEKSNIFKGNMVKSAVLDQIPNQLLNNLSSSDFALVMDAVNQAYHNGKASAGAEMIDNNAVWINSLNKGIEWEEVGAVYDRVNVVEKTPDGFEFNVSKPIKIKDGELVLKFWDEK